MAGTVVIVPARMESTRLPGKPLADICGRSMILRVLDGASRAEPDRLVVATDSRLIEKEVVSAGYEAVFTGAAENGTGRVFQAWEKLGRPGNRIINLQGDEPLVQPEWIQALTGEIMPPNSVVTLARQISSESAADSSVVKVVHDSSGEALYFSRSVIPWGADSVLQHLGLYCFTPESLSRCASSAPGPLSRRERLEQLGWMENGVVIKVVPGNWNALGVDTPADLEEVRKWFADC
ncbi:3-deoxy-manno-octulosonate cytidylyltransferase [Candidatus Fermentibacteria bacterium]|nr:MAG: 3-deoxy-manno-octulosonate cytidylyltransferase [Candidatus Fermentibacteria bacterium]